MDGINIVQVILILVVLVNGLFAIRFVLDVLQHKEELKEEPGNPVAMAIVSFSCFFFLLLESVILRSDPAYILKQNGFRIRSCREL